MANAVERAVQAVGGPSEASHVCGVSYWAVRTWRKQGVVPDTRSAILLRDAAKQAGVEVSIEELAGFNGAGGDAPRPRRFLKGGRMLTATYPVPSPVVPRYPDTAARAA